MIDEVQRAGSLFSLFFSACGYDVCVLLCSGGETMPRPWMIRGPLAGWIGPRAILDKDLTRDSSAGIGGF